MPYTTRTSGNLGTFPSCVLYYPLTRSCTYVEQLSQELFNFDGTLYNQTLILNSNFEVDPTLLDEVGLVCHLFDFKKRKKPIVHHCSVQPYYAGSWVVQLLTTNLGLGATFTHLMIWNFDDLIGAWSWLSPSSLKSMYQNFNWRFWKDDGIRNEDDNKETDPHYREMLKVIVCIQAYLAWYLLMSNVVIVPRCPKQLVFGNPSHFYCHVTCHYLQDRFDFAMVKLFLLPNPLYFDSSYSSGGDSWFHSFWR